MPRPVAGGVRDDLIASEVVPLLCQLVRVYTVSPPGNESEAASVLQRYLSLAGVDCELLAREPHRANLVARIRGTSTAAPRLLFLARLDTVGANPAEWTADPWGGEVRDGAVWGRGALDMKNQAAAVAVALALLARSSFRPAGDVVLAGTADEEVGQSDVGISWLCAEHPDAVRADFCLNEGLGTRLLLRGRPCTCTPSARSGSARSVSSCAAGVGTAPSRSSRITRW